jgi:hypothetical protein
MAGTETPYWACVLCLTTCPDLRMPLTPKGEEKWTQLAAVEFDERAAKANIQAVRPGMQVFKVSAKTNEGMDDCFQFFAEALTERSQRMTV